MSISEPLGEAVILSETAAKPNTTPYIDWPAIFAGAVLASALSLILLTFGSAIGLSMTSAREGETSSLFWIAIVGGIWLLLVQISVSFAGGYMTGRMRRTVGDASAHESDIRDGSNGLVAWGLATLVAATIAYSGVMGAAGVAGQAAGAVTAAAGGAATAIADSLDPSELLVDRTVRGGPDAPDLSDGERSSVGRIIAAAASGDEVDQADRQYLVSMIAARTGVSPEEANQRVEEVLTQAREVEAQARAAAEQARKASMVAAFLTAASLLVGAAVSYWAATMGGNHRDSQRAVNGWYRPW
jgi:hypothetical protein